MASRVRSMIATGGPSRTLAVGTLQSGVRPGGCHRFAARAVPAIASSRFGSCASRTSGNSSRSLMLARGHPCVA
jgi:hypothetical protein